MTLLLELLISISCLWGYVHVASNGIRTNLTNDVKNGRQGANVVDWQTVCAATNCGLEADTQRWRARIRDAEVRKRGLVERGPRERVDMLVSDICSGPTP